VIDETRILEAVRAGLLVSSALPIAALLGAITWRFAGRTPGRRWGMLFLLGLGGQLGLLILTAERDPLGRALYVVVIAAVTVALLWRERRAHAGAFLLGAALPWTLLWGAYVTLLVVDQAGFEPYQTWTSFLLGLVPVLVALGLLRVGDPPPPAPDPAAPAGRPGSRRIGVVARAVAAPESLGPIPISELASLVATVVAVFFLGLLGLPWPLEPVAQVAAGTLAGVEARVRVRPRRAQHAFEAFSWLGEWEFQRVRALTGREVPLTPPAAEEWLEWFPDRPEARWIRVEILCLLDRLDEARQVAGTMPTETAYDRFERAYALDLVDWMAGGDGDPGAVRSAAADLGPADADAGLRADVAMAVRETARSAAANGFEGAAEPLVRVRKRLGSRADGQLRRALWRRTLPISAVTSVVVVILFGTPFG
jgi:hypothetical protein